jgi:hypothetical protein
MYCVNCKQVISIDEGHRSSDQCIAYLNGKLTRVQEENSTLHFQLTDLTKILKTNTSPPLYNKIIQLWTQNKSEGTERSERPERPEGEKNGCLPNTK